MKELKKKKNKTIPDSIFVLDNELILGTIGSRTLGGKYVFDYGPRKLRRKKRSFIISDPPQILF